MNRAGLSKDHVVWIKTGSHRKRKHLTERIREKIKCRVQQIRLGRVRALLFHFQPPPPHIHLLLPPTQLNLLPLLLMRLIITRSAAALSYHLGLLSSLIRVTVGGPTSSFVQGHVAGSLWTGLPPGGDPSVHHGVTHTEDEHELELSLPLSLSFLSSPFPLIPLFWSDHPLLLVRPYALT